MRRHSWISTGSVARLGGHARPGDTMEVLAADRSRIVHRPAAAPDHPLGLAAPEGEYLKGLAFQIGQAVEPLRAPEPARPD